MRAEKICGMNMNFQYFSFDYFLESMDSLNMKYLELWAGAPHLYVEDMSEEDVLEVKKKIDARGMKTVFYTPEGLFYPYNLASDNDKMRQRTLDFYKKNMYAAAELGAENMLLIAGRGYYDQPVEMAWKRSAEALKELAQEAKKVGIGLVLEPLQYEEANLVWNLETTKKMLDEVGEDTLGTMIDTVQMVSSNNSIDKYFNTFGKNLRHVHLTDGNPTGHLTWGDGNLPLKDFLKDLNRNAYDGYLTLEIGPYLTDPVTSWKQGVETVKKVLKELEQDDDR